MLLGSVGRLEIEKIQESSCTITDTAYTGTDNCYAIVFETTSARLLTSFTHVYRFENHENPAIRVRAPCRTRSKDVGVKIPAGYRS